jgi:hypothetical protein
MLNEGWWIVCGVLLVVGIFNLGLALSVLRNRGRKKPYLEGSISELLFPWKQEDKALEELHQQVKDLDIPQGKQMIDDRDG